MDDGLFFGDFDAFDFLEFFDARLDLFCFCGLSAEAIDEAFEVFDLNALVAPCGREEFAALGFLFEIFCVVAVVDIEALVPDLDGAVDGDVEEVAVVGDEDVTEGVGAEVLLEPVAAFEVEVVGGLVEEEEIWFGEEELGEGDAHLPAAGELIGVARPVIFVKPRPVRTAPTCESSA